MSIDVTPVTTAIVQLAAAVILAIGTWAISRVVQWLGLKNAAQATANLDDALQKAVTFGLQQTQVLIKQKGWDDVDVRGQALASALPYMINRFPDTLKAVGLAPDNANFQTTINNALDRAFPHAAAVAAASPATPPATAPNPPTTSELPNQPNSTTNLNEIAVA